MRKSTWVAIFSLTTSLVWAGSAAAPADELFPPNAKPGECYARVFVPATYRTASETLLKQDGFTQLEVLPARYDWTDQRVLVEEESERWEIIPATYEWVEETVMVKPARKELKVIPAQFETRTEQVLDKPAHVVWKKGTGPYQKVDNATGEIMCLVEVPATYKTVTKRVLTSEARTEEVQIPAEYQTVKKKVLKTEPQIRTVRIPAKYETVKVMKLASPPQVKENKVSAQQQTVSRTELAADGSMEWRPILCETNTTPQVVTSIQRALATKGYYNGPVDGIIGNQTMTAVQAFQKANNQPAGFLTLETLKSLGIKLD